MSTIYTLFPSTQILPYHSLLNLSWLSSLCPDPLLPAEREREREHIGNMNVMISNTDTRRYKYHLDVTRLHTNPAIS